MHLKLLHVLHLDGSLNNAANLRTSKNIKHCHEGLTQWNKKEKNGLKPQVDTFQKKI